jgi:hypothetical protein
MTDNADEALGAMVARLRALPNAVDAVMPELVDATREYLQDCYARGVDPADGKPWLPTQIGRKPRLTGSSLKVAADGHTIFASLRGHDARHSLGTARGGKRRGMLPQAMPPELAKRFKVIIERAMREAVQP